MPITPEQTAALTRLMQDRVAAQSPRMLAASLAMHGLCASGVAERHDAGKVAKIAWKLGDAFLEETVSQLLPNGLK